MHGPHQGIGLGQRIGRRRHGDPKVRNFNVLIFINQDVLGLEIAVNNPMAVRSLNCRQYLFHNIHHLGERNGVILLDKGFQIGSFDVLHDHILHTMVRSHIIDADDMRIIELGRRHRFAFKPALGLRIIPQIHPQQFH